MLRIPYIQQTGTIHDFENYPYTFTRRREYWILGQEINELAIPKQRCEKVRGRLASHGLSYLMSKDSQYLVSTRPKRGILKFRYSPEEFAKLKAALQNKPPKVETSIPSEYVASVPKLRLKLPRRRVERLLPTPKQETQILYRERTVGYSLSDVLDVQRTIIALEKFGFVFERDKDIDIEWAGDKKPVHFGYLGEPRMIEKLRQLMSFAEACGLAIGEPDVANYTTYYRVNVDAVRTIRKVRDALPEMLEKVKNLDKTK